MLFSMANGGSRPFYAGPAAPSEYPGVGGVKDGFKNTSGRTATAVLNAAVSTIVLIVVGQSNAISIVADTSFVPVAGTENFNFYDGKNYVAKDPLLGPQTAGGDSAGVAGSSWSTRLASKMVQAGMAPRVVIVNLAIGAVSIAEMSQAGWFGDRVRYVLRNLSQAGLVEGPTTKVFCLQMQGETDALNGTSAATYAATCRDVVAGFRKHGVIAPYFVSKTALFNGASAPNQAAVRQGQADALSDTLRIFAGPDTDLLTVAGGNRQADQTHLNLTGINACADQWLATLQAWIAAHP